MFTAKYFTYDGIFSGQYGLIIADFNKKTVEETSAFSPTLITRNNSISHRSYLDGIGYDSCPQFQFSVICETEIPTLMRREILSWLVGRNEFKKLIIEEDNLKDYYYRCVFTNAQIIYVNGRCHGFRLTATFDSNYAYGSPTSLLISQNSAGEQKYSGLIIENKSDVLDKYIYPIIKIDSANSLKIINRTDDPNGKRPFIMTELGGSGAYSIIIDCEKNTATSDVGVVSFGKDDKLNWVRLLKGHNELEVTLNANVGQTLTISCPTYAKIGF